LVDLNEDGSELQPSSGALVPVSVVSRQRFQLIEFGVAEGLEAVVWEER
jgi:hypothetical protein